jgi:hypothetical protein
VVDAKALPSVRTVTQVLASETQVRSSAFWELAENLPLPDDRPPWTVTEV